MKKGFKKNILVLFLFLFSFAANAQQVHFIYIQTENKQPFYIKLDKKVLSSSASGYLIIPKLADGSYNLTVGFPKNEWPEQNVTCRIDKKDNGYLLKNFGDKGWGLFNLQTMEVLMAGNNNTATKEIPGNDPFTNVLSNVVNDPSIRKKEEVKEEPKPVLNEAPKEAPVVVSPTVEKATIKKIYSQMNESSYEMMYTDKTDTIRLFIPVEKMIAPVKEEPKKEEPPKKEEDKKFLDVEMPKPAAPKDLIRDEEQKKPMPAELVKTPAMINSDCKASASDDDFLKLRKKMAAENNDDDMITVARKVFKSKCFTTDQIKNLSVLFLKDEGKYKFFDAAYAYVTDTDNFTSLEKQLTDEYFINRFKVMIRH
jgi:hypothetical protein